MVACVFFTLSFLCWFFFLAGIVQSPCNSLTTLDLGRRVHKFDLFETVHYSISKSASNSTLVSQNLSITFTAAMAISSSSKSDSSHQRTNSELNSFSNCSIGCSFFFFINYFLSIRLGKGLSKVSLQPSWVMYTGLCLRPKNVWVSFHKLTAFFVFFGR